MNVFDYYLGIAIGLFISLLFSWALGSASVNETELAWATEACQANSGVKSITPKGVFSAARIVCKNNAEFSNPRRDWNIQIR